MPHVRTQIRNAALAALTGLATTGSRVHAQRIRPVSVAEGPALVVLMGGEPEIAQRNGGRTIHLDREFTLRVECKAGGDTADDDVDQMATEIEAALMGTQEGYTLGGLVKPGLMLIEITDPEIDDTTTPRAVSQTLVFKGRYRTLAGAATATII